MFIVYRYHHASIETDPFAKITEGIFIETVFGVLGADLVTYMELPLHFPQNISSVYFLKILDLYICFKVINLMLAFEI
jgi:hypothetical protein